MRLGTHLTDEQKAKSSLIHGGHTVSLETRAKISATEKGKSGHPQSLETRAKMSVAMTGRMGLLSNHWKGGRTLWMRKQNAKRRLLGFVQLNEAFAGSEGHHVDSQQVINMPKALHRSVFHRQTDGRGMAAINAVAYNFLFKQEVEAAMARVTS